MRSRFDEQLDALNKELVEMGALIEKAIDIAVKALLEQNEELAKFAVLFDNEVDQKEKDIENMCLKLLLQQQPVAKDLRLISAALKMITDMERIGDQAADISEITLMMLDKPYIKKLEHIQQMAEATTKMVKESIDAFVKMDYDLAKSVVDYDDVVDDLFNVVKKEVVELIRDDISNSEQSVNLLMIAKYFERIGDHATNIAEWVIFAIKGIHV
ncbi:MAG TPA: phosphate signaling complex protein PhoU [Clostridia bacterium]|nr:phosphate signaling complex protein PhoU [Clostridia bacterium]HPZ52217.1 phosphate signaling complex protein PhoU [Clostridia bacterium]